MGRVHVLDNGLCVTCSPKIVSRSFGSHEHVFDDGECSTCSEVVEAILTAFDELEAPQSVRAAFDPAKHPRNPKGSPGGGRFRSLVDRVKDAIQAHAEGKGDGHPLDGFTREQLRQVAKKRGIEIVNRESLDSIKKKILDHHEGVKADLKPDVPKVDKPKTPRAPRKKAAPKVEPKTSHHVVKGRDISAEVDYANLPTTLNLKTYENDALKTVIERQGFDGKPHVVGKAEFDAAVKAGEVREAWRGVGQRFGGPAPEGLAETYRTGDMYVGNGINGDGVYIAFNESDARLYGPAVLRIGLRKDAKVISADDLDAEMDAFYARHRTQSAELRRLDEKLLRDLARAKTPRTRANIRRQYRRDVYGVDRDRSLALQRDPGMFAALRGYDAVYISKARSPDKHEEMIVLNRTATIVQEA